MWILKKILIAFISFITLPISLQAQDKRLISGTVTDAATNDPLPFVTITLKKQLIGVVTNEEGKFDFYIPKDLTSDSLLISYFGYISQVIQINSIKTTVNIRLEPSAVELKEIVIRPQPPEYYIRLAMRKIKENYPKNPFESMAYYREKMLENKNLIRCDEGVFKTYYPNYLDTLKNQSQLLLFRRAENAQEIAFMSKERKKQEEKKKKKQEGKGKGKKGEETKDAEIDFGSSFGGPESILKSGDISKKPGAFLDSLQFRSYKYSFAKSSSYNNSELMVIDFETKGKVNHVRETGKIYIDIASFAIVKIENSGDFIIPAIVKPILFLYGVGIEDPKYERIVEFQQVKNRWYPKNIQNNLDIKLTNRHWFKPNEHSDFEIEQVFAANKLKLENAVPVVISKRFDSKKDMKTQVHNDENIVWEGLNIIKK